MGALAMRYFLEQILAEHGEHGLANAVTALRAHISYYEGHYKNTMFAMRAVMDDFEALTQRPKTEAEIESEFSGCGGTCFAQFTKSIGRSGSPA